MANTDELTYTEIIPAPHLARKVTVHLRVSGMNAWRARLWLAGKIFAFGAWIAGTSIDVEVRGDG